MLFISMCIPTVLASNEPVEAHQTLKSAPQKDLSPKEYISIYSKKYGISEANLLRVAKCESGLKKDAIHYDDGGKGKHSRGIMQFQQSTFLVWEKKLGEDLDYHSYHDQIKLASFMWSKGQQNQWTCK